MDRLTRSETEFFDTQTQTPIGTGRAITEVSYADNSQIVRIVDPGGHETHFEHDTANRLLATIDAKTNTVVQSYTPTSKIVAIQEIERSDLGKPGETYITSF